MTITRALVAAAVWGCFAISACGSDDAGDDAGGGGATATGGVGGWDAPLGGTGGGWATGGAEAGSSCTDGKQSGNETDVDCGGGACTPCESGQKCKSMTDCKSMACSAGTCKAPACDDKTANGTETDVDCGGECPNDCAVCHYCKLDTDCETGLCENGLCAPTIVVTEATYAANCGAPTPVKTIVDACSKKKSCNYVFNYAVDLGFDPAYGCMKDLTIKYTCTGGTTTKTFYESCAPCNPQNTPTQIKLELECQSCLGFAQPPA